MMRRTARTALAVAMLATQAAAAGAPGAPARDLRDLLGRLRAADAAQRAADAKREAEFRADRDEQAERLAAARTALAAVQAKVDALEADFDRQEKTIGELEETRQQRLGAVGELFGVVRQVAGDTLAFTKRSIVSAQLPDRAAFLRKLAGSTSLPSTDDLERLWLLLQEEMTEAGRVVRFPATIVAADGTPEEAEVVRVGTFDAVTGDRYLRWDAETGRLIEPPRQPGRRARASAAALTAAHEGVVGFALDPSRGTLLEMLIEAPTFRERLAEGGLIGWVTIALGLAGFAIAVARLVHLGAVRRRVDAQLARSAATTDNPLGRVLAVRDAHPEADVETLELRLDEAILRETPPLERGTTLVRVISVAAPLLGLLGTVTGMIQVFQAITLYGTGDPKLMAGGISQALVTTVIGLTVAIPLLLLHSVLTSRSEALVEILEEQAAGVVARRAEARAAGGTGAVAG